MFRLKFHKSFGIWAKAGEMHWINDNSAITLIVDGTAEPIEYQLRDSPKTERMIKLKRKCEAYTMMLKAMEKVQK
jgi:hypothetical protein